MIIDNLCLRSSAYLEGYLTALEYCFHEIESFENSYFIGQSDYDAWILGRNDGFCKYRLTYND